MQPIQVDSDSSLNSSVVMSDDDETCSFIRFYGKEKVGDFDTSLSWYLNHFSRS